jgi:hypothetical protein
LIQSYEESEKADIKLFTTTQISSLGLFAEQGFIFRDSVDSIRSSLIQDKDKESQIVLTATGKENLEAKDVIIKTLESNNINNDQNNSFFQESPQLQPHTQEVKDDILPMLLENLREKKTFVKTKGDNPASHDIMSSANHMINFKERMTPYNEELFFRDTLQC